MRHPHLMVTLMYLIKETFKIVIETVKINSKDKQ